MAVAMDRSGAKAVEPYLKKNRADYTVLLDPEMSVARMFSVRGTPTNFLLNRKGEVVGGSVGLRDWTTKEAHNLIESLLEPVRDASLLKTESVGRSSIR